MAKSKNEIKESELMVFKNKLKDTISKLEKTEENVRLIGDYKTLQKIILQKEIMIMIFDCCN